jgi:glycosyltransferase involved in cell wall biosynthesis
MVITSPSESVYFHVGRFTHPFFEEQLEAAPPGFSYCTKPAGDEGHGSAPRRIALQNSKLRWARAFVERAAIRTLSGAGHVRISHLERGSGCSLIHSAQLLLRSPPAPYVVDFECIEAFCLYQRAALRRPWARCRLLHALTDPRCRFLLPWSNASRRGLETALGAAAALRLSEKTATLLPAVAPRTHSPVARGNGPLRVLFVGTSFEAKGGVEAIRAIRNARGSCAVTLDVVSDVPPRWRDELERTPGVVTHAWPVPAARIGQLFQESELLLFPSHMDTLGFVMLEAMAHGMPVLATRHFAVPELVEDGVSGVLVDGENPLYGEDGMSNYSHTLPPPRAFRRALRTPSESYVDRIAGALASIAELRELHERLAAGALMRVTSGPLSIGRRKRTLEGVYRRSLEA